MHRKVTVRSSTFVESASTVLRRDSKILDVFQLVTDNGEPGMVVERLDAQQQKNIIRFSKSDET